MPEATRSQYGWQINVHWSFDLSSHCHLSRHTIHVNLFRTPISQNFIPHWLLSPSKYDKLICLLYRKRMASAVSKLLLGHLFDVHLFLHLVNTHYCSRLPIIRTFKGNRKKFELSGVRVIEDKII